MSKLSHHKKNNLSHSALTQRIRSNPDKNQPKKTQCQYTPYGFWASTNARLLAFQGECYVKNLGCYLLGNGYRAYSPILMRFLSADNQSPFYSGGLNCYAAFSGDPVNKIDPSGHSALHKVRVTLRSGLTNTKNLTNSPTLKDAHPNDYPKALERYEKKTDEDIKSSNFRIISDPQKLLTLAGEEQKFILTNTGEFIVGNQNIDSFPHSMLKFLAEKDAEVVSAGYVALRKGVVVFSNTTGHYWESMKSIDPNTPVINYFKDMKIIARRVRGNGHKTIPLSYDPWADLSSWQ